MYYKLRGETNKAPYDAEYISQITSILFLRKLKGEKNTILCNRVSIQLQHLQ